jgi:hypothetical protein
MSKDHVYKSEVTEWKGDIIFNLLRKREEIDKNSIETKNNDLELAHSMVT